MAKVYTVYFSDCIYEGGCIVWAGDEIREAIHHARSRWQRHINDCVRMGLAVFGPGATPDFEDITGMAACSISVWENGQAQEIWANGETRASKEEADEFEMKLRHQKWKTDEELIRLMDEQEVPNG